MKTQNFTPMRNPVI